MKTKKILLSTLALSAVFVGCTNEDIEVASNQVAAVQDLSIRPEVGDIDWNFGSTDARIALKPGSAFNWGFQENDQVGAAIIDQALYTSASGYAAIVGNSNSSAVWDQLYDIVNYISTNYPYTYASGSWTTPAKLVEGNYLFYAPFDESRQTRNAILTTLPTTQDCSTVSSAVEAFLATKAVKAVGYQKVVAGDTELKAKAVMEDIYSYPKFTIVNNFKGYVFDEKGDGTANDKKRGTLLTEGTKMTVDSIQIFSLTQGHTYPAVAAIDHKKVVTALGLDADGKYVWNTNRRENTTTNSILADSHADNKTVAEVNPSATVETELTNSAKVAERITLVLGKELAVGESYSFTAVMPAEAYGWNGMAAKVFVTIGDKHYLIQQIDPVAYTVDNDGVRTDAKTSAVQNPKNYSWIFADAVHENKDGVTLLPKQTYPASEINTDSGKKDFAGTLLTINLTGKHVVNNKTVAEAAFQLDKEATTGYYGYMTNADILDMVDSYARYVDLVEDPALETVVRANWPSKNFAIHSDNTIEINSALIDALYSRNYNAATATVQGSLALTTAVKISGDVAATVGATGADGYTEVVFTSNTGKTYTIKLKMTDVADAITAVTEGAYYYNAVANTTTVAINASSKGYIHIINDGVLNLTNVDKAAAVINNGTLNLNENVVNTSLTIYNNGNLTIAQGKVVAAVVNNATGKTITNSGNLRSTGNINNGTITMVAGSVATIGSGTGVIDNSALATVSANAGQTVFATVTGLTAQNAKISDTTVTTAMGLNQLRVSGTVKGLNVINKPYTSAANITSLVFAYGTTITTETGGTCTMPMQVATSAEITWKGASTGDVVTVEGVSIYFGDAAKLNIAEINLKGAYTLKTAADKPIVTGVLGTWNGKTTAELYK